jgi:hypothetical protein
MIRSLGPLTTIDASKLIRNHRRQQYKKHRLCGGQADRGHRLHIRAEADVDWNRRADVFLLFGLPFDYSKPHVHE